MVFQMFLEGFLPFSKHFLWATPDMKYVKCISWICRSFHKAPQVSLFVSRVSRYTGASVQFSTAEGDLLTWPTAKCGDTHLNPRVTEHQMGQSPRALSSQLQATDMGDSTQMDMTQTQTHNAGPDPSAMFEPGLPSSIVRPTLVATKKVCLELRCNN